MSCCRICGDEENVKYYPAKRQSLCAFCAKDTPRKVSRETFCRAMFAGDEDCPSSIQRDFYDDYLASGDTLDEYIRKASEPIGVLG